MPQAQLVMEKSPPFTHHDQLFKELIRTFFEEFLEAFFPEIHPFIDLKIRPFCRKKCSRIY